MNEKWAMYREAIQCIHKCGLDKETAMTKKSVMQQVFVACGAYEMPWEDTGLACQWKYAVSCKFKILMVNQLYNYHVLSDHCYYIKQHKPVKHLLKGYCPGLGKDGAVGERWFLFLLKLQDSISKYSQNLNPITVSFLFPEIEDKYSQFQSN